MRTALCSLLAASFAFNLPAFAGCPQVNSPSTVYKTLGEIEKTYCGALRAPTKDEDPSASKVRDCKAFVNIIVGYDIVVGEPAEGYLSQIEYDGDGPHFAIRWIEGDAWYEGDYASIDASDVGLIDRMFFYSLTGDARARCFAKMVK